MTSTLQNRLVGTIIVVALVVILLPEFLDGEKRTNKQEFVDVPPVLEVVEVATPNNLDLSAVTQKVSPPVEIIDELALDDTSPKTQNSVNNGNGDSNVNNENNKSEVPQTASVTADNSNSDKDTITASSDNSTNQKNINTSKTSDPLDEITVIDSGWVVQLGSFRHEKNVKALLKKLNDAGYRAYSSPVMTSVGQLNKVFVGPELNKQTLEQALPHLQEITQLKGKITAFEVSAR